MIKYFCDICGKELRVADRIKILTDLDFVKAQSLITGLSLVPATNKYKDYLEKCKQSKKIV